MARTRGGGVIRGASAQPRRKDGNSRVAGIRGQMVPVLPRPPLAMRDSTETVAAASEPYPGSNTPLLSSQSAEDGHTFQPPEAGGLAFSPQIGDSLVTGTHVMGGSPSAMGMLGVSAVEAAGDVDAALGPDLAFGIDELGDSNIGIHDSFENTFVDNSVVEDVVGRPPIEPGEGACSGRLNGNADQSSSRRLATARRKSPLLPPKVVWRMLFVDPDSNDPKRDARLLENAASEALRCACVFDVATDIVEALADLRDGTMWVYRGVFINESLIRYKGVNRRDSAIQGKHLAQFLRLVGMSRTRMILLVAGGIDFNTKDASAHGLSAVLRKPFTKTGFCNILRGMYLGSEPDTDGSEPTTEAEAAHPLAVAPRPVQASFHGQHCSPTKRLRGPEGAPLAAAAEAAPTLGGSAALPVGHSPALTPSPSYPACLGFTPFTPFISPMKVYALGSGFLRPRQPQAEQATLKAGPQRRYTKIAPREKERAVCLLAPPMGGEIRVGPVAADTSTCAVAVDRAGEQGASLCSAGVGSPGKGKDEGSGESSFGPRGGDDCASGAPELPLLSASPADDVLSGQPTFARVSTEAAAAVTPESHEAQLP